MQNIIHNVPFFCLFENVHTVLSSESTPNQHVLFIVKAQSLEAFRTMPSHMTIGRKGERELV
jgi:hypothetical protein